MTAIIPTFAAVQQADSAATPATLILRDASADATIARRATVTRIIVTGGIYLADIDKTTTYTATADDNIILCDGTGGAFTVTLPAVAASTGQTLTVKRTSAAGNITLDPSGAELIDGAATKVITTQYGFLTIYCDGTTWHIIATGGTIT